MSWPNTLDVALKEWAVVCRSLLSGRQVMLLRKGGIYESAGEFELEHPQFLLFPTYLHQNLQMLKPTVHGDFEPRSSEPDQVQLQAACRVTHIEQIKARRQMDALDSEHVWAGPLIDMRFNYRPENPLYLLLVRTYTLPQPVTVENTPAYAGCKSWVRLDTPVEVDRSLPVLRDEEYEYRSGNILDQVRAAAG
jgi:hypothetical protein